MPSADTPARQGPPPTRDAPRATPPLTFYSIEKVGRLRLTAERLARRLMRRLQARRRSTSDS